MAQKDLKVSNRVKKIRIDDKSVSEFKEKIKKVYTPKWHHSFWAIAIGFLLFFIPGLILMVGAKQEKEKIAQALKRDVWDLYKRFFENNFKNIEYLGPVSSAKDRKYRDMASKKRPTSVPGDARPYTHPGVAYKVYDSKLSFNTVNWVWTRKTGKTTVTYSYFYLVCYGHDFQKSFDDFSLVLHRKSSNIFASSDEHKLGSQEFNKIFKYKSSNPVTFRKLLRPSVQASMIDFWTTGRSVGMGTPELYFKKGEMIVISSEPTTKYRPFVLNFTLSSNADQLVNSVIHDIETDLAAMQFFVLNIATLKKLFK